MLDELALDVRRRIYDGALNDCSIPSKAALARATLRSQDAIEAALGALADAHMIVLQRDGGEVLMANPFSAVPTPFVVTAGSRRWYANCIWDAMGIAAMTQAAVQLDASCGCCGTSMPLAIPGDCRDEDERVAHFAIPAARWWDDIVYN